MEPLPPTLFKALCDAALFGDIDTIRHLMATEPNFVKLLQNPNELTPLHFAATQGHTEIIQLLLDYYAANAQSDVQSFINNQNNPSKTSPLHMAAPIGREDAALLLIKHGAHIHAKDINGWTTFHIRARVGHVALMEILLAYGANINEQTNDGVTPLMFTCSFPTFHQKEAVNFLLKRGADHNIKDNAGKTTLDYAVEHNFAEIALMLLSLDPEYVSPSAKPTIAEIVNGQEITMELSNNINEPVMDNGFTRLHVATNQGFIEITRLLLALGADSNCKDNEGNTPLHCAIKKNHLNISKLLLDSGACPDKKIMMALMRYIMRPCINRQK